MERHSGRDNPITAYGRFRVDDPGVGGSPQLPDATVIVHPTAVVEPGASVGGGTRIWHHAHIRAGARVGCDCVIGKGVFVDAGAVVGDRVKIENNVSVFSGVTLGDGVFVGPGATFTNDLYPRAIRPDGSPLGPGDWKPVATVVGEGASIGANATVLCGLEIGVWAMVGAGSVVVCDVLPHELVVGNPARHLGWVCACGRRVEGSGSVGADRVVCEVCG